MMSLSILKTETGEASKAKMTVAAGFVNIVAGLFLGKLTSCMNIHKYNYKLSQIIHTQSRPHYPD